MSPSSRLPVPAIVRAHFVSGAPVPSALPPPVALEVAFAGRSNVGKSSVLNALVHQHRLARTSATPGCTRQISFFEAHGADGSVVHLVDLPGYGYAARSRSETSAWGTLVEHYLAQRATLRCLVLLVDARRGLEKEEHALLDFLARAGTPGRPSVKIVLVATKMDKTIASHRKSVLSSLTKAAGQPVIGFSARSPETGDDLWRAIRRALGMDAYTPPA